MQGKIAKMLLFSFFLANSFGQQRTSSNAPTNAPGIDPWSFADRIATTERIISLDGNSNFKVTVYEDYYLRDGAGSPGVEGWNDYTGNAKIVIYVPEGAGKKSPMLYMVNNLGWSNNLYTNTRIADGSTWVSKQTNANSQNNYIAAALKEGFVIVEAGLRRRSIFDRNTFSPVTIGDAKAVIRYLRLNHKSGSLPAGDPEKIVISGLSGGGNLSVAIGASGNNSEFYEYLYWLGAAGIEWTGNTPYVNATKEEKAAPENYRSSINDNVFAVVGYCPITNLEYADLSYNWTYMSARARLLSVNGGSGDARTSYNGAISPSTMDDGRAFAAAFPSFVASLGLTHNGKPVTATYNSVTNTIGGTLADVMEKLLKEGIRHRLENGGTAASGLPVYTTNIGTRENPDWQSFTMADAMTRRAYAVQYGVTDAATANNAWKTNWINLSTNHVNSILATFNLHDFLYYVAAGQQLKAAPAFDGHYGTAVAASATTVAGMHFNGESDLWGVPGQSWGHVHERSFKRDPSTVLWYDNTVPLTTWDKDAANQENTWAAISAATEKAWQKFVSSGERDLLLRQGKMTNSIPYLLEADKSSTNAPHWMVRTGMLDRDHDFGTWTLLYLALEQSPQVQTNNFRIDWNTAHTGYQNAEEAIAWIKEIIK